MATETFNYSSSGQQSEQAMDNPYHLQVARRVFESVEVRFPGQMTLEQAAQITHKVLGNTPSPTGFDHIIAEGAVLNKIFERKSRITPLPEREKSQTVVNTGIIQKVIGIIPRLKR